MECSKQIEDTQRVAQFASYVKIAFSNTAQSQETLHDKILLHVLHQKYAHEIKTTPMLAPEKGAVLSINNKEQCIIRTSVGILN